MTKKKKPDNARFSTEPESLGGTDSQGQVSDDFGVKTGNSYIYRTKNGKTNTMGFTLPDDKAKEYASELQRETRGMKKGCDAGYNCNLAHAFSTHVPGSHFTLPLPGFPGFPGFHFFMGFFGVRRN